MSSTPPHEPTQSGWHVGPLCDRYAAPQCRADGPHSGPTAACRLNNRGAGRARLPGSGSRFGSPSGASIPLYSSWKRPTLCRPPRCASGLLRAVEPASLRYVQSSSLLATPFAHVESARFRPTSLRAMRPDTRTLQRTLRRAPRVLSCGMYFDSSPKIRSDRLDDHRVR